MEKLTEYVDGKYIRIKGTKSLYPKNERDGAPLSNAIARLAAYEDTGLEPEAVEHLKLASMGKAIAEIKEFEGVPIDRLRELAQAEKEGRLVVLPCEIGSPVYSHARKLDGADYVRETEFWWSDIPQMGKTVFLTREAAEAALKEMEENT